MATAIPVAVMISIIGVSMFAYLMTFILASKNFPEDSRNLLFSRSSRLKALISRGAEKFSLSTAVMPPARSCMPKAFFMRISPTRRMGKTQIGMTTRQSRIKAILPAARPCTPTRTELEKSNRLTDQIIADRNDCRLQLPGIVGHPTKQVSFLIPVKKRREAFGSSQKLGSGFVPARVSRKN